MTKVCELKIKDCKSKDDIVLALVNNGYTVSVNEEREECSISPLKYYAITVSIHSMIKAKE